MMSGMNLFVPLPSHIRDIEICSRAAKKGLSCSPLSQYYISSPSRNGLQLGCCSFTEQEMDVAMDMLVGLIRG
jgi:DNA-binding transcriptional MocR family regulator